MAIRRMRSNELEEVCRMAANRILDTPDAEIQLAGVEQKEIILYHSMHAQLTHYLNTGEVWILDNGLGLLAVHHGSNGKFLRYLASTIRENRKAAKSLSKSDIKKVSENGKQFSGLHKISWRKKLCGKNHYYIDLIVIDASQKGSGAFRSLLEPLIARSEEENIPLLLDTYNPKNVGIYEHFYFKVIEEHSGKINPELRQFCMARFPEAAAR